VDDTVDNVDTMPPLVDRVFSVDAVIRSSVVIEFFIIDVTALVENVMLLLSVNDDGATISMVVVSSGDKCIDELTVLSISRERIVDVTEFIVVAVLIDD
jgi:hypothetical protein